MTILCIYIYIYICIYIYIYTHDIRHPHLVFWPWPTWRTDFSHVFQIFFSICPSLEGTAVSRVSEPQAGILMKIYLWSYLAELGNSCRVHDMQANGACRRMLEVCVFFNCSSPKECRTCKHAHKKAHISCNLIVVADACCVFFGGYLAL